MVDGGCPFCFSGCEWSSWQSSIPQLATCNLHLMNLVQLVTASWSGSGCPTFRFEIIHHSGHRSVSGRKLKMSINLVGKSKIESRVLVKVCKVWALVKKSLPLASVIRWSSTWLLEGFCGATTYGLGCEERHYFGCFLASSKCSCNSEDSQLGTSISADCCVFAFQNQWTPCQLAGISLLEF